MQPGNKGTVMRPVFRKGRPDGVETDASAAEVSFIDEVADWCVDIPCGDCGGYRMALQVRDAAQTELAESRARAFVTRVHGRGGCLACEARSWREGHAPAVGDFHVWWDTDSGEWMAWGRLDGHEPGVSLPLGIHTFWAPQEVRAAARALWSSDRMPLRVACSPEDVASESSTTYYDAEVGRWKLKVACFDCEGFELSLTSFGRGAVEAACDEALACLDLVAREGCPSCRTRRERALEREGEEPCVWYDTQSRDWMLWQPLGELEGGVTLPLGIGRFDARRAVVYRAAAGLLFDSELFLDGEH